jgi:multidrug efflux pump subunit AcrB
MRALLCERCSARLHGGSDPGRRSARARCNLPFLGRAYFPRTDPGQFVINVRMPSGTRLEGPATITSRRLRTIIRDVVKPSDLDMIVSNIGVYPDLSAIYTTNASMDTAFVQVSLKKDHSLGSYEYMQRVREKLSREMPELTYFQAVVWWMA